MTVSASSPDAACCSVAPVARKPASTTAKDEVKPTSAVTTPARIGSRSGVWTAGVLSGVTG